MKFRKNLENLDIIIRKLKGVERVFFINISDTNVINKRRSYGFEESIIQYNKIFKETFSDNSFYEIIDYYEFVDIEKDLLSDGIHLSIDGHKHITELLLKNIRC
jgi:lysophospholipase L1-like esterase